jgi:hypothetical protein
MRLRFQETCGDSSWLSSFCLASDWRCQVSVRGAPQSPATTTFCFRKRRRDGIPSFGCNRLERATRDIYAGTFHHPIPADQEYTANSIVTRITPGTYWRPSSRNQQSAFEGGAIRSEILRAIQTGERIRECEFACPMFTPRITFWITVALNTTGVQCVRGSSRPVPVSF